MEYVLCTEKQYIVNECATPVGQPAEREARDDQRSDEHAAELRLADAFVLVRLLGVADAHRLRGAARVRRRRGARIERPAGARAARERRPSPPVSSSASPSSRARRGILYRQRARRLRWNGSACSSAGPHDLAADVAHTGGRCNPNHRHFSLASCTRRAKCTQLNARAPMCSWTNGLKFRQTK